MKMLFNFSPKEFILTLYEFREGSDLFIKGSSDMKRFKVTSV